MKKITWKSIGAEARAEQIQQGWSVTRSENDGLLLSVRRFFIEIECKLKNIPYGCYRCGASNYSHKGHSVIFIHFDGGGGRRTNGLCEWCWSRLNPEQRFPYYERDFNEGDRVILKDDPWLRLDWLEKIRYEIMAGG